MRYFVIKGIRFSACKLSCCVIPVSVSHYTSNIWAAIIGIDHREGLIPWTFYSDIYSHSSLSVFAPRSARKTLEITWYDVVSIKLGVRMIWIAKMIDLLVFWNPFCSTQELVIPYNPYNHPVEWPTYFFATYRTTNVHALYYRYIWSRRAFHLML